MAADMSSATVIVDGYELIYEASFLVLDDRDVEIRLAAAAASFNLVIRFTAGGLLPPTSPTGRWDVTQGGVIRFTFTGWNNAVTTAMESPERFGDSNGRGLSFQMAHRKVGPNLNEVHWWIMLQQQPMTAVAQVTPATGAQP
jgi:hypothetical protein